MKPLSLFWDYYNFKHKCLKPVNSNSEGIYSQFSNPEIVCDCDQSVKIPPRKMLFHQEINSCELFRHLNPGFIC